MMGQHKSNPQLFNYAVNLEKRVQAVHPLRRVKAAIDLSFVREEVAHCYGKNGNESVAPEVILKMMFLLFFDDIKSERELMEVIGERLDYLWFLDYGLDEKVPDHNREYGEGGAKKQETTDRISWKCKPSESVNRKYPTADP